MSRYHAGSARARARRTRARYRPCWTGGRSCDDERARWRLRCWALGAHTRAARAARMYCVLYGRATTIIQLILSTGTYHTIVWSRCNDHTTYIQSDRDLAHPRLQNRGPISVSKSRSINTITYKIVDLHNIVCKDRDFARTAILQPTHVP